MSRIDLNLLTALDALLTERSVTAAAQRLNLSVSATSRALTRLRAATGDRLLLQAGRTLVLTPYAEQLSQRLPTLAREVQTVLSTAEHPFNITTLKQRFTLRVGETFIDLLGAALIDRVQRAAPHVQLRFAPKPDWEAQPLREGLVDLEIGTVRTSAPEVRTRLLFCDRYVGVCRIGHPLLNEANISVAQWATYNHVATSLSGKVDSLAEAALEPLGLRRQVTVIVPAYTSAMQLARHSDLLAVIPHSCLSNQFIPDYATANGLQYFELPVQTPAFNVSAIWHPRLDQEPAQRWLRAEVLAVCLQAYPQSLNSDTSQSGA